MNPNLNRRDFIRAGTLVSLGALLPLRATEPRTLTADVCVYAGNAAGLAAAVAAAREGCRVLVIEPSRWLGGMTGGGLVHIDWEHRRAEISFLLDDARAGDDARYAKEFLAFLQLVRQLGFDDLKLHRLFTETYAMRTHHISVYDSFGLQLEGVLRDHVRIGDKYVHSLIHGIIASHE